MKLTINGNLLGKQTIKYHLMKYKIYLSYKTNSENMQSTRTKHFVVAQLDRIELKLKKSLVMINYYYRNRNSLLFIGLPAKWNKFFNSILSGKENCFCLHINEKRLSKLTSDQFRSILNYRFIDVNKKKSSLIINFSKKLDCKKISDIPVVDFDIANEFTLGLLGSSLSTNVINIYAKYI